ncbi:hypothelical protein [Mycoplasmopsis californica HAZ160_1]|uniref:Hypothelical protein n=1 Tax=Mycoplasmopsis californica HAZ160_1 TaxID=1397850 RepID=A0AAT9F7J3_9BACT|nr:thermonuclease family protein [Mycoplasmopsis californica]BAP00838.1 hypothelical protein [Mycoplasmopsis californica HAZ160_1]BBG40694.1 hypothelical protein [Mycoplasmopsis californica]BBG41288.1 hypothelical protein [Mycoplasmopsis californica]BBG41881.1 hypothelical protein [Mycoplasmopsis californica]BBG42474.1 hypothelical protein [Mycoplasmopsis californica]
MMKKLIIPVPLYLPLFTASCTIYTQKFEEKTITKYYVADGDTIYFYNNDKKIGIRILGIDTPETKKKNNDVATLENHFAQLAKNELINFLKNKPIKIEKINEDKYGRWVCRIYNSEGVDAGLHLIKGGFARVKYLEKTPKNINYWNNHGKIIDYFNTLKNTEEKAKRNRKGIWKHKTKEIFKKK